jgi:hypothetical protein
VSSVHQRSTLLLGAGSIPEVIISRSIGTLRHRKVADNMWSRLTRGGDGLPREKVDAIVRLIDQYLAEEASLRNLQSDKQTIHPRDLPPDKREALIEEIFEILKDARKK